MSLDGILDSISCGSISSPPSPANYLSEYEFDEYNRYNTDTHKKRTTHTTAKIVWNILWQIDEKRRSDTLSQYVIKNEFELISSFRF